SERANGLARTIFEFQAVDWDKQQAGENRAIPTDELAGQMRLVASLGGKHFGYYPDDFAANTPDVNMLRPAFSPQAQKYTP
ncbi:MAG: poly-beta-1,6-N-acetyl-D-glucosamine N-deacetylase PgaB, partial [Alphaproteobacteria bacterium]|nr:poly-beta-1,6-N-acetyl-D-glucosamine N-deacetylase PgaB [Alphaproteobacteria bacterium]